MASSFDGVKSLSRDRVTNFFRLLLCELPTPRNAGTSTRNAEILERRTLFTVYFCLGYRSEVKEARIFHFLEFDTSMLDALRIVIELKKVRLMV